MENYVYIKKSLPNRYIEFHEPLNINDYNIGNTWADYHNNYWILLNESQLLFHQEHPNATVYEVFRMELNGNNVTSRTLESAKQEKIAIINKYDANEINSFTINGNPMWLTVEERQQLATQISASESVGREEMTRWFNGNAFTFTISQWKQMLVALEIYSGDALNVTEAHKAAVNALTSIADVDNYDHTTGYPEKLEF